MEGDENDKETETHRSPSDENDKETETHRSPSPSGTAMPIIRPYPLYMLTSICYSMTGMGSSNRRNIAMSCSWVIDCPSKALGGRGTRGSSSATP